MTRIRAAVLSAGGWSLTSHIPTLQADPFVDIVAVTSPESRVREDLATRVNRARILSDWQEALRARPDIVIVSSPPGAHEPMVTAALRAGAHVLVEKPFARDAASARRMHRTARETGKALLTGFGWPASPIFAAARSRVADGTLGPVEQVVVHLAVNIRGLLTNAPGQAATSGLARSGGSSYTDPSVSAGGTLAVSMSHQIGMVCWLTGRRIESVAAQTFPSGARADLHASMVVGLAGGAHGCLSSAATHPDRTEPGWSLSAYGPNAQLSLDTTRKEFRLVHADGSTEEDYAAISDYDVGAPTKALIEVARGTAVPESLDSALALHVCEVTDAAYASASADGLRVPVRAVTQMTDRTEQRG